MTMLTSVVAFLRTPLKNNPFTRLSMFHYMEKELNELRKERDTLHKGLRELYAVTSCWEEYFRPDAFIFPLSIVRLEIRNFYDSAWALTFMYNKEVKSFLIKRYENESFENLFQLFQKCKTFKELASLDVKDRIYYD